MKIFSTAIILLICITSKAQEYNWDVGVKYERDNNSWLQLEGRYHLNEDFALIGQISGSLYNSSNFRYAGFDYTDSIHYYSNSQHYGELAKLNIGAQYRLPFKRKFLYTGLTIGAGYSQRQSAYSFYTGPDPYDQFPNQEIDPSSGVASIGPSYIYVNTQPQNFIYRYNTPFFTTDLLIGADLPLYKRLMFTVSLNGGIRLQENFFSFNFALAAGLRYQLGKNAQKES